VAADKRPSFQFYPGDWMKDPALRACSLAARGLWMDCLCLMFESPRRGYLQHANGQPVTAAQVARMVGCTLRESQSLLEELHQVGVSSRTETGVIYSRRMVRDEEVRVVRAQGGERGAEHGHKGGRPTRRRGLVRGSEKTPSETPSDTPCGEKAKPPKNPPSSSTSSSPSTSVEGEVSPSTPPPLPPPAIWEGQGERVELPFQTPAFVAAWNEWCQHRREKRQALTPTAVRQQFGEMTGWGEERAIRAIRHSIAKTYQGIYEAKTTPGVSTNGKRPLAGEFDPSRHRAPAVPDAGAGGAGPAG
jgi:hypothetical protein